VIDEGCGGSRFVQCDGVGPLARGLKPDSSVNDEALARAVDFGSAGEKVRLGDSEFVEGVLGRPGRILEIVLASLPGLTAWKVPGPGDAAWARVGTLSCGREDPTGCLGGHRDLPDCGYGFVADMDCVGVCGQ